MRLLEYQAKDILRRYGIPVGSGEVCRSVLDVQSALERLEYPVVVKAQVPSGKRGKGGGIKFAPDEASAMATTEDLLDSNICGYKVKELLVEKKVSIEKEYYAGVITDGSAKSHGPVILFSASGGMDIEEIAAESPGSIYELPVNPLYGPSDYELRSLVKNAGVPAEKIVQVVRILSTLYRVYWNYDAELAEINPLGITANGDLIALDAKLTIDNSARFRQPNLAETETGTWEARAASLGLSCVNLEGNIGIISNGAGLTMATMDQLALAGGRPANFMDTGERILRNGIADGFALLEERGGLKAVLVNVFGGGVRCDEIAKKIIDYLDSRGNYPLPVLVCLQGRNAEAARKIIKEQSNPAIRLTDTMEEAVSMATALGGM